MSKRQSKTPAVGKRTFKPLATIPLKPPKSIELGESVFAVLGNWEGSLLVHVRQYRERGMHYYATPDGVAFNMSQWKAFNDELSEIMKMIESGKNGGCLLFQKNSLSIILTETVDGDEEVIRLSKGEENKGITLSCEMFYELVEKAIPQINEWVNFAEIKD